MRLKIKDSICDFFEEQCADAILLIFFKKTILNFEFKK